MKKLILAFVLACFAIVNNSSGILLPSKSEPANNKLRWWQDARFGMFIHWGVYSIPGRGEWLMYQEHIPFPEYALLADEFNPKEYNPKE